MVNCNYIQRSVIVRHQRNLSRAAAITECRLNV